MLKSWRLLVYGHDQPDGSTASSPSASVPTPTAKQPQIPTQRPESPPASEPPVAIPAAPTSLDTCSSQRNALSSCLLGVENGSSCGDCVIGYWPEVPESCNEIDDETCTALDSCPCDGCGSEVIALTQCLSGCTFPCGDSSNTPTETQPQSESGQSGSSMSSARALCCYGSIYPICLMVFGLVIIPLLLMCG